MSATIFRRPVRFLNGATGTTGGTGGPETDPIYMADKPSIQATLSELTSRLNALEPVAAAAATKTFVNDQIAAAIGDSWEVPV